MGEKMGRFKVIEKFVSINGEGQRAGELACFIRFAGCNLNCSYCDTRWANEERAPFSIESEEEIYEYIKESGVTNITITGGEPLLQPNIDRLLSMLGRDKALQIEIETNGSCSIEPFMKLGDNISFTVDYKLGGSGMEDKMCLSNYGLVRRSDTVKFVISDMADIKRAVEIVERYNLVDNTRVYFSSSFGQIQPRDIVEYMKGHKLNGIRLQLQLHKYIWEPDRKGV